MAATATPVPTLFERELAVTPKISFSTVQFSNETVNTVVNSILVALIVANFGSMVHKIINVTKRDYFCYNDYLRTLIYSSSDDFARLLSWINGENPFISANWLTHNKTLRLRRLIFPLLARALILALTFASIALTIPSERKFILCSYKDFRPVLANVAAQPDNPQILPSFCADLPLNTRRGEVNTRLAYCSSKIASGLQGPTEITSDSRIGGAVDVRYDSRLARIEVTFYSSNTSITRQIYVEWSRTKGTSRERRDRFRAIFSDFDERIVFQLADRALKNDIASCGLSADTKNLGDTSRRFTTCAFNPETIDKFFDPYFRSGLFFKEEKEAQPRVVVSPDGTPNTRVVCPLEVSVDRPLLNMLPMAFLLILFFQLNLAVSFTVSQYGNIDDATHHLIKEAVNADVTANPVEISEADRQAKKLELRYRTVHCADSNDAHAGFLNSPDDVEVDLAVEPRRCVYRRANARNRLYSAATSADNPSITSDRGHATSHVPIY